MADAARNADLRLAEMRNHKYKVISARSFVDTALSQSSACISTNVTIAIESTIQSLSNALLSHDLNLFPDVVREYV